jgi:hypothetical protein
LQFDLAGQTVMNILAVIGLFLMGFFVLAAGGIAGGAVHQTPSIGTSIVGCVISTVGLALCLTGIAIAKSKVAVRIAEVLSVLAIAYGFFHSLVNLILQNDAATLGYGIYMSVISIAAIFLLVRRAHVKASHVAP